MLVLFQFPTKTEKSLYIFIFNFKKHFIESKRMHYNDLYVWLYRMTEVFYVLYCDTIYEWGCNAFGAGTQDMLWWVAVRQTESNRVGISYIMYIDIQHMPRAAY